MSSADEASAVTSVVITLESSITRPKRAIKQVLAIGEVAVDGRPCQAGGGGDLGHAGVRPPVQQTDGGIDDGLAVSDRIGPACLRPCFHPSEVMISTSG